MRRHFAVYSICFLLSFCGLFLGPAYGQQQGDYAPGEVIVRFRPDVVILPAGRSEASIQEVTVRDTAVASLNQRVGVTHIKKVLPNWKSADTLSTDLSGRPVILIDFSWVYRIFVPQTSDIRAIAKEYSGLAAVIYAEPNFAFYPSITPNDPKFIEQWALHNTNSPPDTFDIDAPLAWDIYPQGGSWDSVIVAVLDTGIDYNHEDFGRTWLGPYPNLKVIQGFDYASNPDDSDPMDDTPNYWATGHGTSVAGILGALTHFTTPYGIAGIAGGWNGDPWWNPVGCRIMPVKVLPGYANELSQGINYAWTNGAKVINMSLNNDERPQCVHDALWNAYTQGVVLVAASGNGNTDSLVAYPGDWSEFIITVGAINIAGNRWVDPQFPNFGSNYGYQLDVVAPGEGVVTTIPISQDPSDPFRWKTGTSFAAPHVSGIAALIKSVGSQGADCNDIEEIIERTALDLPRPSGNGYDIYFGHGLVKPRPALDLIMSKTLVHGSSGSIANGNTGSYEVYFYLFHRPHYDTSLEENFSSSPFQVRRYERIANVTFPRTFSSPPWVWARANGTKGWKLFGPGVTISKYVNDNYAEVVDGTLTNTGCTLRTYVYDPTLRVSV